MEKKRVYVAMVDNWNSHSGDYRDYRVFENKQKAREEISKDFEEYKKECREEGFDEDCFVETNEDDFKSFSPDEWEKYGVTFEIREVVLE